MRDGAGGASVRVSRQTADRLALGILGQWQAEFDAARMQVTIESTPYVPRRELIKTITTMWKPGAALDVAGRNVLLVKSQPDGGDMLVECIVSERPKPEPNKVAVAGCTTATAMMLWKVKRGDNQPKQQAVDGRLSKMRKFLAWAKKPDDLTQVTSDDLQGYKEYLLEKYPPPSNVARDRLTDVVALFNVADENRKFKDVPGGNPAAKIVLPPKRKGLTRLAFTDAEARTILLAAREHPDPVVRWVTWLNCFLGTIIEEVSDARVSHIVQKDGIWCLDITETGRTTIVDGVEQTGNLKTAFRSRLLPLHPAVIREGFLDRVDYVRRTYGENAPLFPEITPDKAGQRNARASDRIMRFLRGIGIQNEIDPKTGKVIALRDSYGWRHRFATQLENMPRLKPDRQRYMTGHAAPDVHGRVYLEHPPKKLKSFIDAISDPTTQP
ncbi:MAG TPA: hypothetical protein VG651_17735 [Stellaceae bacterium]|nr:hypothetical protein [Stellaceae bacterium]